MSQWLKRGYIAMMFVILYLPLLYLMLFSFNDAGNMQHFTHPTWRYYHMLFEDKRLLKILIQTFMLAFSSALIATLIGLCGALFLATLKHKQQQHWLKANNILLVSPDVVIGASFLILFTLLGIKLGIVSVLLSHIAFSVPIVVITLLPAVTRLNPSYAEAAYDLGANTWQIMTKITLPQLTSSLIMAYFMAFTYSLDDFAVTFFVTGNGFSTLAIDIYSRARQGISLEMNALSTIVFFASLILVIGYYMISKPQQERIKK